MKIKRTVFLALLTAIALTIFMVEAQIPIPIPGVKLGLANIVTLFALYLLGPWDALIILLLRCSLGCILTGQPSTFLYSITGGILSLLVMLLLKNMTTEHQIFAVSVFGGIAHNIGQILAAALITHTPGLVYYLPVLLIAGVLAGIFTGFTAQYLIHHLQKLMQK